MNILVLGGTQFVGRHFIELALAEGHNVTLVHRGKTNPGLFPTAKHILADRREKLTALENHEWDVCVDANAYIPREVELSTEILMSRVDRYVFVSTVSVYDGAKSPRITEESPLLPSISDTEEVTAATYGGLKVACEQIVQNTFGANATIVRPGYLVGPYDPTNRFPYWVGRFASGEEVLLPKERDCPLQVLDARDLAVLLLKAAQGEVPAIVNTTGPASTFAEITDAIRATFPSEVTEIPEAWLAEKEVRPGAELPLYSGTSAEGRGLMLVNTDLAIGSGLPHRPLEASIRDTAAWLAEAPRTLRGNPLSPERAKELIAEYQGQA